MPGRIEDYAMIGDLRTAALIDRKGSIDWFCCPRFDSGACFAALLGTTDHGRWLVAPHGSAETDRCYHDGSMVLETRHKTATGQVTVIDFMPIHAQHSSIVRLVKGISGKVRMHTELAIRFDYGVSIPWVTRADDTTLLAVAGPNLLTLRTPIKVHGRDMRSVCDFTVREGETVPFVLTHSPSHLPPPQPLDIDDSLTATQGYWREWSSRYRYKGPHAEAIRRSLIVLKALSYRPSGGIVAAVTTSLPETIGGARNWDYRYCWLRDATFTLLAFLNSGYREEAQMWQRWLLRAIAGSPDQIQIMYGVGGDRQLREWEADWLPGYEASRPVRIGNAAALQLQLDVYGELANVMAQASRGGLAASPRRHELREVFLEHLEKIWRNPDHGIWEMRGAPQHFVHSKAMAWLAFDRASRAENSHVSERQRRHWRKIADQIHADVCRNGVDRDGGFFVQHYGANRVDASLLQLALVGFLPPRDRRIVRTVEEIERTLIHNGLVHRYDTAAGIDGLPSGEGAFLACSFWLVDNYLLLGRAREARRLFGRLVRLANDVGLLAEEYDAHAKRMLGNFPQAFSHVALVNSAIGFMAAGAQSPAATDPVRRRPPRTKKIAKKTHRQ